VPLAKETFGSTDRAFAKWRRATKMPRDRCIISTKVCGVHAAQSALASSPASAPRLCPCACPPFPPCFFPPARCRPAFEIPPESPKVLVPTNACGVRAAQSGFNGCAPQLYCTCARLPSSTLAPSRPLPFAPHP
jgi:hypothetical protein